jgi:hypothetical protein
MQTFCRRFDQRSELFTVCLGHVSCVPSFAFAGVAGCDPSCHEGPSVCLFRFLKRISARYSSYREDFRR